MAADPKHLGARIGVLMVLHTWGQKLEHHPHVHCVVPGGGLAVPTPATGATATESAVQAPRWVSCRPDWFLPVPVLSPVFRGKYLAALRQAYHDGELQFAGSTEPLANPQAWRSLVREMYQKGWVVYAKKPFGGPEQVLKYLTGYTHRVALSNRRLVKLQDDRVTFTWKDYANGCTRKEMTLDAWEFVRRFAFHIVPEGLVRIRRFGLLAHRDRGERLALCRSLLAAPAEAAGVGDTVAEPLRPSGLSSEDARATSCAVPVPPTVQPQPASATRIGIAVLAVLISLVVSSGDISWLPSLQAALTTGIILADRCPSCGVGRLQTIWQESRPTSKQRHTILVLDVYETNAPHRIWLFHEPGQPGLGACPNICSCSRMAAGFRWALAFSASAQPYVRTIPLNLPRRCRSDARSSKDCGSSISVATRPTLSPGLATETCGFLART